MSLRVRLVPGIEPPPMDPILVASLRAGVDADEALAERGSVGDALARLQAHALLEWSTTDAVARPLRAGVPLPVRQDGAARLSRFALLRRDDDGWLLESGRSPWVIRIEPGGIALLAQLDAEAATGMRDLLGRVGMLSDHDDDRAGLGWEPHDRYFAHRSRNDVPRPDGFRLQGVRPPEPARRDDGTDGPRIRLPVPSGPRSDEPTLWEAMAERRSVREFADEPVRLDDLGDVLWRTLRIVEFRAVDDQVPYERVLRPVPSGGAMHATDLWLVCARVQGVPAGIWRYDPFTHELVGRPPGTAGSSPVPAWLASPHGQTPPITGILTARHARTSWKYGRVALSLELKDIGVIMEAIQLAAGAAGLGMCPWGSGPTAAVAEWLGVDPEIDMPLGEFVLGVPLSR